MNQELGDIRKDRCIIGNYIPHRTPINTNREAWHYHYIEQLIDLYHVFVNTINTQHPNNNIDWGNSEVFNKFSKFIYLCSSKYLQKLILK